MFRHFLPVFRFYSLYQLNSLTFKRSVSILSLVMANSNNSHGPIKQIGTHDGIFHTDDAMACYMLTRLPEYRNAAIVRSRDSSILDKCDILVDVGSVYDHSKKRYDHHQREFTHTMSTLDPGKKFQIKLSSAGLIYFHYGRQIISEMLDIIDDKEQVEIIFDRLYESLIQEVDGIDNGVEMFDGEPRYRINTSLDDRVRRLIPPWTEPQTDEILLERFHEAMKLTGQELEYRLNFISKVWHPARMIVETAISNREKVHSSGEIIELPSGGVPWKEHIFTLEKEKDLEGLIKFAIFENPARKYWQIVGTPATPKSFVLRVPLHHEWRGLRDEQLSEKSGIPGCIFVHTSGFTGANATREGLIEMAVKSLKDAKSGGDMI